MPVVRKTVKRPAKKKPAVAPPATAAPLEQEEVARLAYWRWQQYGCPEGSAEEDWLWAEQELRRLGSAETRRLILDELAE